MAALQQTLVMKTLPQGAYAQPTGRIYAGGYSTSPAKNMAMSALTNRCGHNCTRHLTPDELECNIGGLRITESKLRELFDQYDVDGSGFLERDEVKRLYKDQENFGIEPTDAEVEAIIRKYEQGRPDGKISFDEFAALFLNLAQR
eukprot:TRINITY_DN19265_c0_g1_i1.p1 TRINITY_DN19265_c0_g1~~TRINITY_DN19265_c0_g1_i1.p1  ORF type:complete len:169 (+),score=64.53 TRINITY_DN19265_c0_g1_i1:73-507(+)